MFSRKKKNEIPPIEDQRNEPLGGRSGPPSYRTSSSIASSNAGSLPSGPGGYRSNGLPSSNRSQHSKYSRDPASDTALEASRNELFKGARAPKDSFANRDLDQDMASMRDGQRQATGEEDEEEEVEAIKQQIRFTKQESLSSTRNALRIAREAEETARGTLMKLGDQSDRIANTERHLDLAKAHSSRAEDEAKEIVALNRSIFRPTFQLNKKAKRDAEEKRIVNRHLAEKEEREETRRAQLESRNRTEGALKDMDRDASSRASGPKPGGLRGRLAERSKYQFENTASDDELEDELDGNLDEISALTGRLKTLGQTMGNEIDAQNRKLDTITGKTDQLDTKIYSQTQRLAKIK